MVHSVPCREAEADGCRSEEQATRQVCECVAHSPRVVSVRHLVAAHQRSAVARQRDRHRNHWHLRRVDSHVDWHVDWRPCESRVHAEPSGAVCAANVCVCWASHAGGGGADPLVGVGLAVQRARHVRAVPVPGGCRWLRASFPLRESHAASTCTSRHAALRCPVLKHLATLLCTVLVHVSLERLEAQHSINRAALAALVFPRLHWLLFPINTDGNICAQTVSWSKKWD